MISQRRVKDHTKPDLDNVLERPRLTRSRPRFLAILAAAAVLIILARLLLSTPALESPIVTLASGPQRASRELPTTLRSLLHQTLLPKEILLHISRDEQTKYERLVAGLPHNLRALFAHPRVSVRFVEDVGPATKLVPALAALLAAGDLRAPLVVLDDDHIYHPRLLETLVRAHGRAGGTAVVGVRGWRVRQDLRWGVLPAEYDRHVLLGWRVAAPYRVGVLTANEGYLVLPRFFAESSCPGATAAAQPPVLSPLDKANPEAAHLVDDIFINGHLARNCVPRLLVPAPGANVDVTHTHTLEEHMREDGISRARANDVMLGFFGAAWAREGIWYEHGGRAGPRLRWFVARAWVELEARWRWFWGR